MPRGCFPLTRTGAAWRLVRAVLLLVIALGAAWPALAQDGTPVPASSAGLTRAEPVPIGGTVQAGPVELQVRDVLSGPEAVSAVMAASPTNLEPRDGSTYVAVSLMARNTGSVPLWLDNDDFALTGDSGLVWRFLGAQPPAPALNLSLAPGESTIGWVAFGVPVEETSLLLLFDSLELSGSWADRVLAVQDGASIADLPQRAAATNQAGSNPAAPATFGAAVVTEQWSIELLDAVSGAPAFDLVDYRSGALGVGDAVGEDGSVWVALRFRVQNAGAGGEAAHFPTNAFVLADASGEPLLDVLTLTPPRPDAAGDYYPGGMREGWVMFDVPVGYTAAMVRFAPFAHTAETLDPRFIAYGQAG